MTFLRRFSQISSTPQCVNKTNRGIARCRDFLIQVRIFYEKCKKET